jgi:hypothetical protein
LTDKLTITTDVEILNDGKSIRFKFRYSEGWTPQMMQSAGEALKQYAMNLELPPKNGETKEAGA